MLFRSNYAQLSAIAEQMISKRMDTDLLLFRSRTGEPAVEVFQYLKSDSPNNPIRKLLADANFTKGLENLIGEEGYKSYRKELLAVQSELNKLANGLIYAKKENRSDLVTNIVATTITTVIRKATGGLLSSGVFYSVREIIKNTLGQGEPFRQLTRAMFTKDFDLVVKGINNISDVSRIRNDVIAAFGANSPEGYRLLTRLEEVAPTILFNRQATPRAAGVAAGQAIMGQAPEPQERQAR